MYVNLISVIMKKDNSDYSINFQTPGDSEEVFMFICRIYTHLDIRLCHTWSS